MSNADDDDDDYACIYENGHWEWDNTLQCLGFVSDMPEDVEDTSPPTPTLIGTIDFKDDLDLIEQQRFRKRFQRRVSGTDCVSLQDIKDVAFFTAPQGLLSRTLINIFHMPITERYIRALILYSQYFIQTSDEMSVRISEMEKKIRTPMSDELELEYRDNLEDLRLLVAKEYSCMMIGAGEIAKYHHMGASKKLRSLSKRDLSLFESILRISIQIVWLALGRQSFNKLELEIHRLFKSEVYNIIEHKLHTNYKTMMTDRELFVLFGHCVRRNRMINTFSPLGNEMQCHRPIDYRILGLGVVIYPQLSHRLRYLERVLIAPESTFDDLKLTLGIIGMPRAGFDTMLKELKLPASSSSSTSNSRHSISKAAKGSKVTMSGSKKSNVYTKLLQDIFIPEKYDEKDCIPDHFPTALFPKQRCHEQQRRKWVEFVSRKKRKQSNTMYI